MAKNIYELNLSELYPSPEEQAASPADAPSEENICELFDKYYIRYGADAIVQMSHFLHIPAPELISMMDTRIIQDPAFLELDAPYDPYKGWVYTEVYLSSSRHENLTLAAKANKLFNGRFERNITLLQKLIPSFSAAEISFQLGASWIGEDVHESFIKHVFKFTQPFCVTRNRSNLLWHIVPPASERYNLLNREVYGVMQPNGSMRFCVMEGLEILKNRMNGKDIKIFRPGVLPREIDVSLTLTAIERGEKLQQLFDSYIRSDKVLCEKLVTRFNHMLSELSPVKYDGSCLSFDYLPENLHLYPSQQDAIARIIRTSSNLLFVHSVGAGKGYIIAVGCYELYRLGLSKRNLIVVPGNMLNATEENFRNIKGASVLVITPQDFTPQKRRKTLQKVIDGDYTAVIMPFSVFDMLKMSKGYQINAMKKKIQRLRTLFGKAATQYEKKSILSEEKKLIAKLSKFSTEYSDPDWQCFDELNFSTVFIDEAHNYKNIDIPIHSIDNIVGLHSAGSAKCNNCLAKIHSVKRAIFTTATPITNSLSDLFVMQSFLQPEDLYLYGLSSFNSWITSFGKRTSTIEEDITGSPRVITRFSQFCNLHELTGIFGNICDFYQMEDTSSPEAVCEDIFVPITEEQKNYISTLSERADNIRAHNTHRTEDNFLKITSDGRKCALDMRLIDNNASDAAKPKVSYCADKIHEIACRFPNMCQVVFSDLGTPKSAFNVYDALKTECVRRGIKASEIAFVHDATTKSAIKKLFDKANRAEIKVIIGSTEKLGTGVNIQKSLIALHHLDVPWKPSQMVQRNGRACRPGNDNEKVYIFRYMTSGSFDSYSWQILENKQRAISSFFAGYATGETETDFFGEAVLDYAEVKAACMGNGDFKHRFEIANLLDREKIALTQREKQLKRLAAFIDETPAKIAELDRSADCIKEDITYYRSHKEKISRDERIAFGEELLSALKSNGNKNFPRIFDRYQGFDIILPEEMNPLTPYIYIQGKTDTKYYIDMSTDKPLGVCQRLDFTLDSLDERVKKLAEKKALLHAELNEAQKDCLEGNPHAEKCSNLTQELLEIDSKLKLGGTYYDNND